MSFWMPIIGPHSIKLLHLVWDGKKWCNWSAIILNDVITCLENCYIFNERWNHKYDIFFYALWKKPPRLPWHWWFGEKSNFLLSLAFIIFNAIFLLSRLFCRCCCFFFFIQLVFINHHNGRTWNIYLRDMKQFFFLLTLYEMDFFLLLLLLLLLRVFKCIGWCVVTEWKI